MLENSNNILQFVSLIKNNPNPQAIVMNELQRRAQNNPVLGNIATLVHREGSGLVTLRALPNGQCRSRFKVTFGANLAAVTAASAVSLAVAINGEPVSSSTMIVTPAAVGEYFNVNSSVYLDIPTNCCSQISVENTSAQSVSVQNANLIVERVA
jgi:hypothetical protein